MTGRVETIPGRAICPVCFHSIRLEATRRLAEHHRRSPLGKWDRCPGSGRTP